MDCEYLAMIALYKRAGMTGVG